MIVNDYLYFLKKIKLSPLDLIKNNMATMGSAAQKANTVDSG